MACEAFPASTVQASAHDRVFGLPARRAEAEVRSGQRSHPALLLNLSDDGAMIEADVSAFAGDRLTLVLSGAEPIDCTVGRVRGRRLGLEFGQDTRRQVRSTPWARSPAA